MRVEASSPLNVNSDPDLNRETLKMILDNSYDEIFVVDEKGVVLYVNSASEQHYGLKAKDMIGRDTRELVEQGYYFPFIIPEVLKKRKRIHAEQKTNVGKRLMVTATPVFNNKGEIELIVENSRDITQLEAFRQDLEKANELVRRYRKEVKKLRESQLDNLDFIAHSDKMRSILELAQHIAEVDTNVLLLGETGSGKGVLARYIHKISTRKHGPFFAVNCAAIPHELLESELFGYCKGAFTGASKEGKKGLFELADEGTLLLDEIAEVPLQLQAKLLEVIQEHRFIPVGGVEPKEVDVRILAATNRDLKSMVKEKKFRNDLYYRLNVIEIEIPPLRERTRDIMPLIYLFLNRFDKRHGTRHQISKEVLDCLLEYNWPGNIRELEHIMERLSVTTRETTITPDNLPLYICNISDRASKEFFNTLIPLKKAVEEVTRQLIVKAYKQWGSSYKVASALHISQTKAYRLLQKFVFKNTKDSQDGVSTSPPNIIQGNKSFGPSKG